MRIILRRLSILILAMICSACSNNETGNHVEVESDSEMVLQDLHSDPRILAYVSDEGLDSANVEIISDPTKYSRNFINGLKECVGYKSFTLNDSIIYMEYGADSAVFPAIPEVGKEFLLTGKKDHLAIALKVQRINYTTINYAIEMVEFGNSSHNTSGEADIQSLFFLGAESRVNSYTDEVCFVTEFSDYSKDSCFLKIGLEYDKNGSLWAWIDKNCNGKVRDVFSDDFPTLVEK